jgi:tRNA (mo5U34)-methyltransferase
LSLENLKRWLRPEPLIRELEIRELIGRALAFQDTLNKTKTAIAPKEFGWYPWDSFGTLVLLDKLLTGRNRFLRPLIGADPVLDLGCGDGDLAFLFESIGCRVCAVDHPEANYNRMQGVAAIKTALDSSVRIAALDLDRESRLPIRRSGLALCLGLLYHLKNPYGVLEMLAGSARYCLLSTAITRFAPDQQTDVNPLPAAFLAGRDGLRGDDTNYWIFTEGGLRTLLDRTEWEVCDWLLVRADDSVLWSTQRDERVLCLLRSRRFPPVARTQLASGWHVLEADAWRWTERRFSIALAKGVRTVQLSVTAPPILATPVTLTGAGAVHTLPRPGDYDLTFEIPPGAESIEFELDRVLEGDEVDGRERGLIVREAKADARLTG